LLCSLADLEFNRMSSASIISRFSVTEENTDSMSPDQRRLSSLKSTELLLPTFFEVCIYIDSRVCHKPTC